MTQISPPFQPRFGQASLDVSRRVAWLSAGGCGVAVLLAVLATHPGADMGYCDDFAYVLSALGLEQTGHTVYNGWAAAGLGWMMFYGALIIKLFGFSFPHLHASVLPFGMACAVLMHRIYARLGLRNADATFATLTLVLSLLFVPLTFSFMTDVPGLFVFLLCFYLCLRALAARTPQIACAYVIVATLSNAVGGTVRQFDWMGLFAMVPAVLWCYRRQRVVWVPGAVVWVASMAYVRYFIHWFNQQPYSIRERYLVAVPTPARAAHNLSQGVLIMGIFVLPVTIAFLLPQRSRPRLALGALVFGGVATSLVARFAPSFIAPYDSEILNVAGIVVQSIIGWRPVVLTPPICLGLTVLTFATLAIVVVCAVQKFNMSVVRRIVETPNLILLVWTLLLSTALTFSRSTTWSRYYISILVLLLPMLLRLYRMGSKTTRLPWVGVATLAIVTAFTIASVHDQYASERARIIAADVLIAHGYPRDTFWGGFEYDGWTQIVKTGTLNDVRLGPPTAVYRVPPKPTGPPECSSWFAPWSPDIHAVAQLSYQPMEWCGTQLPGIEPIHYRGWFPPQDRTIYFLAVPSY